MRLNRLIHGTTRGGEGLHQQYLVVFWSYFEFFCLFKTIHICLKLVVVGCIFGSA